MIDALSVRAKVYPPATLHTFEPDQRGCETGEGVTGSDRPERLLQARGPATSCRARQAEINLRQ